MFSGQIVATMLMKNTISIAIIMVSGFKPSYDYDLHNHLLSNESDTIVQIANRNSKIKTSILTLS